MRLSIIGIITIFGALTSAGELAPPAKAGNRMTSHPPLPRCIDDKNTLDQIKATVNASRHSSQKYSSYRTALHSDSNAELVARLAYAETLAANCPEQNEVVSGLITEVIVNRVRLRNGNARSVVFQRDQFSSSLNIYSESRYQDFLCPKNQALWSQVLRQARRSLSQDSGRLHRTTVNYFLYKHSPRWTKKPWDLQEDRSATTPAIRQCVRVFKVPNWK